MQRSKLSGIGRISVIGRFSVLALAAQTACAPVGMTPRHTTVSDASQTGIAQAEKSAEESLPGLIVTEIEEKKEPQRLYSFSLRGANVREVLMAISKQTSFNIVVDPDVGGNVTVDLKDVTLKEALDTLTDLSGLTYSAKRNIIRVFKPVPETRIFSLQYVNLKRTGASSTSAQIGAGGGGVIGSGGVIGTAVAAAGTTTGTAGTSVSGGGVAGQSVVTTSTETDLWRDIEAGIGKLLSPEGKMVVDKQSGTMLVTDFPKVLDQVGTFLERIEGSVQRQVLIEARIVEVDLDSEYQFGIDWSAIAKAGALRGNAFEGRIFSQQLSPDAGDFQIGVTSTDFAALLNVLSTQGEVNVLSSPKLATLNNQTAILRSATDDVFFVTEVERTPIQGGGFDSITTVTPRTVTIGVVLSITPQISPDGSVILHVRPTVSRRSGDASISTEDTTITVPILDVREADVIARAKEGQVVIIGGLMQDRKTDEEKKVPLLGDLPGIGRLFRSTVQERGKSELVVLLRPVVLVGKKTDEITAQHLERVEKLKGGSPW
jgi:MSHA biogenesis protein MshL